MEKEFPGVKIYLSCREDHVYLLQNEDRIITKNELKDNNHLFGYVRELLCNMISHPIEEFMNESKIPYGPIKIKNNLINDKCVLLTKGIVPIKSLTTSQIDQIIKKIGHKPEINGSIHDAGWIISVENEHLYESAIAGKRVTLISTGFGDNLFKNMFPKSEIWTL